jgi:ABC-2 type transport system permease protein
VGQAFNGSNYVQTIVTGEVQTWLQRYRSPPSMPVVGVEDRVRFNANLTRSWFGAVVALIDMITLLSVLLTGSALIRERERGTVEHLLVMPVTPAEIMTSKVWSMGLVVLVTSALSMRFVVQGWLGVPIQGSVPLFLCGTALHLFAVTSLGMFLATFARTMPQFALLMIMVLLPLQMLDGGMTPRESMPEAVQQVMLAAPTTHFVMIAQGILFRGGGIEVVWPQFLALTGIGTVLFGVALARFRRTIGTMA